MHNYYCYCFVFFNTFLQILCCKIYTIFWGSLEPTSLIKYKSNWLNIPYAFFFFFSKLSCPFLLPLSQTFPLKSPWPWFDSFFPPHLVKISRPSFVFPLSLSLSLCLAFHQSGIEKGIKRTATSVSDWLWETHTLSPGSLHCIGCCKLAIKVWNKVKWKILVLHRFTHLNNHLSLKKTHGDHIQKFRTFEWLMPDFQSHHDIEFLAYNISPHFSLDICIHPDFGFKENVCQKGSSHTYKETYRIQIPGQKHFMWKYASTPLV